MGGVGEGKQLEVAYTPARTIWNSFESKKYQP